MENLGDVFKKAREDKNLTIKDVSLQTNIGSKFIKAIENNDFSVFPGEAYTVGFIRNYAEFLKVDPELIIKLFYTNQIAESETPIEELVAPTKPRLNPIPIILLTVVVVAVIVVLIFAMRSRRGGDVGDSNTSNTQETTTRNNPPVQQTVSEPQGNYTELPFFDKKTVGDNIFIKVKDKKLKITISKVSEEGIDVAFSSVGDNDFLVNMRRTFTIGVKKQLKFDVERNREYDFSIGVDSLVNQAQVKLFIKKVEDPYENQRYYDYFTYQAPDQATLMQLQQGSGDTQQQSGTESNTQTTTQGTQTTTNTNQQTQTQTQTAATNTPALKLNLLLSNSMSRDSAIYVWVRKDSSPDIRTIRLNRNQTVQLDATSKLTLDTNNLFGLKIVINGREFKTRSISNDGGVGKLRIWVDKNAAGRPEIKWEINR